MTHDNSTAETLTRLPAEKAVVSLISLAPVIAVVFIAYLVIGIAMPVLPIHVSRGLGLSTFVVGIVAGSQFAAALVTRIWAGHYVDTRGAKKAVAVGLLMASASGALYGMSLRIVSVPAISVGVLLLGRAVLGAAESFIITGALSWGIALTGAHHTGKVMAWVGTALYAAFAVGAPAGTALYSVWGFQAIALATILIPFVSLLLVGVIRSVAPPRHRESGGFGRVVRAVWMPGLALALSGVGFAAITTFIVLLFAQHGWGPSWLAFTSLSIAFMTGRVLFGHLPDKVGGAWVALICVVVEAAAQAIIWRAGWFWVAMIGITLTGLGYSLVYPALGVEAVRRAPPERRGLAMGAYTAFLDLSLGLSSPVLGLVADHASLPSVFLVSTLVVLLSVALILRLKPDGAICKRNGAFC